MQLWAMQEIGTLGTWLAWGEVGGIGVINSGDDSSTAHIALSYCFAGPELSAVNYSFSLLIITRFC